jgi:hypothetical protein
MHALGCTAAEAFDRMREISQTRHVKVTDVAATIIKAHRSVDQPGQPGAGEPGPADPAAVPGSESPGPGQPAAGRRARGSSSGQAATRKPSASRSSGRPAPRRPPGSDRS